MSTYTALYRKFRPTTFAGVIGQDHIVQTLKNQIRLQRVSHAYLFCGTHGTGKTSTAKIFARTINCLNPTEIGEPCNACSLCKEILEGRSVNVIEIDAASNNSVENIREIREEVKYPPTQGTYKVYIIDEVHMLSNSAFNALLKTLEEPPAHVIFILATTDPQKVPATILSRCQRFDFRRITTNEIADTLQGYLAEEGISATYDALHYVAQLGNGSMRDSLSILDQCLAFYSEETVTLDKVLDVVGAVDLTILFQLTDALSQKNAMHAMEIVEKMMHAGRDMKQFVTDFLQHLRNLLLVLTLKDSKGILDLSTENLDRLKENATHTSAEEVIYYIERFSKLQSDLRYAANERILLEVLLLRLCADWEETDTTALAARLSGLERKVAEGVQVVQVEAEGRSKNAKPKPRPVKKPPALPEDMKKLKDDWAILRNDVPDAVLRSQLGQTAIGFQEDNRVYLVCDYSALMDMIKKRMDVLEGFLEKALGKSFEVQLTTKEAHERWTAMTYGTKKDADADAEFESLAAFYLPEADIEP